MRQKRQRIQKGYLVWLLVLVLAAGLLGGCTGRERGGASQGQEPPSVQADTGTKQEETEGQQPGSGQQAPEEEEPGQQDPGEEEPGQQDPGEEEPGQQDPEEAETPALNPETVVYGQEQVCANARVNIRKAPSTDSEVVRVASRREEFTRTADDGEWSAVLVDGAECFVASRYLSLPSEMTDNGYLVVIDAGHQGKGNSEQEPIGPGASETKAKVASGTTGVSTGIPEYQMTLAVAMKLRDELEARGYQVQMVRESHDVNISNAERAQMANSAGADAFVRLHGNGVDDSSVHGILAMCQTASNPYNGGLYSSSRKLSDCVVDGAAAATGAKRLSTIETDTMSGINWCQVPVAIIELGFMTNPAEDEAMATDSYQAQLAAGIADGLDAYFGL
ncbi:MAG: SH3 domain-containing protein [Lachnospiraceae bacterium]|nr:SH3 domain-containing protein [Lachnospiraceae bacterium]